MTQEPPLTKVGLGQEDLIPERAKPIGSNIKTIWDKEQVMYFSDDDMYEGLKLSLDTLVNIVKNETDLNNKRKAAVDLAQIILQTIKIKSDKEDWNMLMKDEKDEKDEKDNNK